MTRILSAKMPRASTTAEYLRFFRDLAREYNLRAGRLERHLLRFETIRAALRSDLNVQMPSWELADVCCFTDATKAELQTVLPSLFDAYRRLSRVTDAAMQARYVKRQDRVELVTSAGSAIRVVLDCYLPENGWEQRAETVIDGWLSGMLGPCAFSEHEHFGKRCRKPVPWTKTDMGGGRSEGASARTLYAVPSQSNREEQR